MSKLSLKEINRRLVEGLPRRYVMSNEKKQVDNGMSLGELIRCLLEEDKIVLKGDRYYHKGKWCKRK